MRTETIFRGKLPALLSAVRWSWQGTVVGAVCPDIGRTILTVLDPSFTGESGGQPRSVASPDIATEDSWRRWITVRCPDAEAGTDPAS